MKTAEIVLWALTPVFLALVLVLTWFGVPLPLWLADLLVFLVVLLPACAMLIRTFRNKKNNLNVNYFILKLVFVILLISMALYLFIMTLILAGGQA